MKKSRIFLLMFSILCLGMLYGFRRESKTVFHIKKDSERIVIELALDSDRCTDLTKWLINTYNNDNKYSIEIKIKEFPSENYNDTINMLMTSGKNPDIFLVNTEWLTGYIYNEWLMDISPIIKPEMISYYPSWVNEFVQRQSGNGNIYTIPSGEATFRMVYNRRLFELSGINPDSPPETFEEFKEYAHKISEANENEKRYGFAFPVGEEWTRINYLVEAPYTYSNLYFYNYPKNEYDLTVYREWLDLIISMKKEGIMLPSENTLTTSTILSQFAKGNIGMIFASSKDLPRLLPKLGKNLEWEVAYPPAKDRSSIGKGKIIEIPDMMFGVSSKTEHPQEAMEVWKFLYSQDFLIPLFKEGNLIPLDSRIKANAQNYPLDLYIRRFLPGEKDSIYPLTPLYDDVWFRFRAYDDIFKQQKEANKVLSETSNHLNKMLSVKYKR